MKYALFVCCRIKRDLIPVCKSSIFGRFCRPDSKRKRVGDLVLGWVLALSFSTLQTSAILFKSRRMLHPRFLAIKYQRTYIADQLKDAFAKSLPGPSSSHPSLLAGGEQKIFT